MALGTGIGQWQWEYNDFLFGDDTSTEVIDINGLDFPELRSNDAVLAGAHGALPGQDRLEARDITFKLEVYEDAELDMWTTLHALSLAMSPSDIELPLTFKAGDQPPMRVYCRPRKRNIPMSINHLYNKVEVDLMLNASDPLIYSETQYTSTADAPTVPTGRAFSATYPWNFGAPGTGGVVDVFNAGTAPTSWTARVFGPCTNPTIIGPGGSLTWESSLLAGEFVEFDAHPSRETVLVGGSSSQFGQLTDTSVWFLLPPGGSNVVLNTGDGLGSVEFNWRDAWWSVT